jgi:hypothetical protein
MNELPAILSEERTLGLDKAFFDQFTTLDEKQDLYADIKRAAATSSWMQADFFRYLWEETDEKTLNKFSGTVGEPAGTVNNYIRTAQAFTEKERNPMLTFSHHFQASLADSYDSKTKKFTTQDRYKWLEDAVDQRMTTRQLNEEIMRTKKVKELGGPVPCTYCNVANADVMPFNFFNAQSKHTDHLNFHETCYKELINYAKQER